MVLKQGEQKQGMLEGKEAAGIHTGAAGEDIFKWGQGARFKMHGTTPCLKPLLQEQWASFTLLLSLYLKPAYSFSPSFFLNPNLVTFQYAYWETTENPHVDNFLQRPTFSFSKMKELWKRGWKPMQAVFAWSTASRIQRLTLTELATS